jgi:hypothetical protein
VSAMRPSPGLLVDLRHHHPRIAAHQCRGPAPWGGPLAN